MAVINVSSDKARVRGSQAFEFKRENVRVNTASLYSLRGKNQEAIDTLNKYNEVVGKGGWLSSDDIASYRSALDNFVSSSNRLRELNSFFSDDDVDDSEDWQKTVSSMEDSYRGISDFYSKWKDEDEYKTALEAQKEYQKNLNYDIDAARREIEEMKSAIDSEYDSFYNETDKDKLSHEGPIQVASRIWGKDASEWLGLSPLSREQNIKIDELKAAITAKEQEIAIAERIQKAAAIRDAALNAPDFAEKSGYVSTKKQYDNNWQRMFDRGQYDMGYDDVTYEYINNQNDLRSKIAYQARKYSQDTNKDPAFLKKHYDRMTEEEVSIYNYYYSKYGKERAEEYLFSIEKQLEARENEHLIAGAAALAEKAPVISSALSVATSLGSSVEYISDLLDYGSDLIVHGEDARMGTNQLALATNAVRGTVADKVNWEIGNWDAFDFLYNTTMSGLDSMAASVLPGGAGGVVLGLSAAAQGTNDGLERGMSSGQAFWNGLFSGAFESLFETVSIGQFKSLQEVAPDNIKTVFKNLAKSMLVNCTEEMATEIANIGYDTLVNGEFANYTFDELKNGAWKQALAQVIESGASGALMGVGMGGIGNAVGYHQGNKIAKQIYGDNVAGLVGQTLENVPNSAYAMKMQSKLDGGKSLSGGQIRRLVELNDNALIANDTAKIKSAIRTRLTELGETGDISKLSDIIFKEQSGEKLTKTERNSLIESKYGRRVSNELNADNIRSGNYSSAWAEQIGTNKINPDVYNKGETDNIDTQSQEKQPSIGGQASAQAVSGGAAGENASVNQSAAEGKFTASEAVAKNDGATAVLPNDGASVRGRATMVDSDGEVRSVKVQKVSSIDNGVISLELEDGQVVKASDVELDSETDALLYDAVTRYRMSAQDANAFVATYYETSSDMPIEHFTRGFGEAYTYGKYGISERFLTAEDSIAAELSEPVSNFAYNLGKKEGERTAAENQKAIDAKKEASRGDANGKTGRRKGTVQGRDVSIADLKKTFNDTQNTAYKILCTFAEATGIDIVLYKSNANAQGKFNGAQGGFKYSEDKIYIDINAGLKFEKNSQALAKYTMLRTFSHEFTHFIEKWNPICYNEFRKAVFDELTARGENVNDLIEEKQAQCKGMTYDKASREVVAEAMTDILPDTTFVQTLANKHKNIFEKLLSKLKEFISDLKAYFKTIGHNPSREANALKEQIGDAIHYADNIVQLFDKVALEAVENYQAAVGTDEAAPYDLTNDEIGSIVRYKSGGSYTLNAKLREGVDLDKYEQTFVDNLDKALDKLPTYKGTVYRNIGFDGFGDKTARDEYVAGHIVGRPVRYNAYTSSSSAIDGYEVEEQFIVHHIIQSINGRNLSGYGSDAESEVLFPRKTIYFTKKIEYDSNGTPTIYLTEAADVEQGIHEGRVDADIQGDQTGESGSRVRSATSDRFAVYAVQGENSDRTGEKSAHNDLQGISERNTVENSYKRGSLQGVQAEVKTIESENGYTINEATPDTGSSDNPVRNAVDDDVQYQQRTETLLDREVLEFATNELLDRTSDLTPAEVDALKIFNKRLSNLKNLQEKRKVQGALYREQQFGKNVDRVKATQTLNRMHILDEKIRRAEASVLSVEDKQVLKHVLQKARKVVETQERAQGKQALAEYREKAAEAQLEMKENYQQSRKKAIEGREKTAMRHKIRNVVNDLNQYLLKGTKDKHVPIELQKAVALALDSVNMDTVGAEERIAKLKDELMRAESPEKAQEISRKIDNISAQGGNLKDKLTALKAAYDGIINSDDPIIANSHDEVISNKIESVKDAVGETALRDMSLDQLNKVYEMYKMVLKSVRDANKTFLEEKGEAASELAREVIDEEQKLKQKPRLRKDSAETVEQFSLNNLKPVYLFNRLGSKVLNRLFGRIRAAEDVWAADMAEAKLFREAMFKKYNYKSWDFDKKYDFTSTTGHKFSLSLDQIMSLYALSKRDQAAAHLEIGGFAFDGLTEVKDEKNKLIKYKLKDPNAYNLSDKILADIVKTLDDFPGAREFVDEMQKYLAETMGEKGNEVSLQLYDIKLFKDKNYFPLIVSDKYLARAKEKATGDAKIKNRGFTKETKPNANSPVVLSSFMDVWASHVNDMCMYHAFTLPLEDFYRVYNFKVNNTADTDALSVVSAIEGAHGNAAVKCIDQLLKDINGGAVSDPTETISKKMISSFKKAAVLLSLSVVIQQPSAIVRAQAYISPKYFVGGKVSDGKHAEVWAEIKKYAPVAIIKEMGSFDTGMGRGAVEWLKGDKSVMDRVEDFISRPAALADELTWCAIWNAVKRETMHNNPNLNPKTEEFLKAVGERFTEVIVKTQVYDSTLSRSANMRSKSAFMQMATAFMAEPTTSINMLEDAFRSGNKKFIGRVMGAVCGSVLLNSILVSFIYALRDDDDDETFIEKYFSHLATELIDGINPLTYIPFVKDIWSVAQGFDVERADMTLITNTFDAFQQLVKVATRDTSSFNDEERAEHNKALAEAIFSITDGLAALKGIPLKNVRREVNGLINGVSTIIKDVTGRPTTWGSLWDVIGDDAKNSLPVLGWLPDESRGDKLYYAIISGDEAYEQRLRSTYKNESTINSAIRRALRDNDKRIKEAAIAKNSGDNARYEAIALEILNEGFFRQSDIAAAINAEINELNKDNKPEVEVSNKEVGWFTIDDYFVSIQSGDKQTADRVREDIINTYIANGRDRDEAEAAFDSSLRSSLRKYDSRIRDAAMAQYKLDVQGRIAIQKEILAEKNFSWDNIRLATSAEVEFIYDKIKDAKKAMDSGNTKVYDDIIEELIERGYPEDFILKALKK